MNSVLNMDLQSFKLFKKVIYNEAGINLTEKKICLLTNRLRRRVEALNLNSFNKYYQYLKNSEGKELPNMINAVTTNVTHFFRNPLQISRLKNNILPDLINKKSSIKNIKVLSGGCSTGEEVYTIAIILSEYLKDKLSDWNIRIDGIDICTEAVDKAKIGIYRKDILKNVNNNILNKYFKLTDNGTYKINDRIKSLVNFKKFNLNADRFISKYDIIFCRNVIIYFDKKTKEKLYQKLYNTLKKDGYLFIGHSEGLFHENRFKYIFPGIYMKRDETKINISSKSGVMQ